MVGEKSQWDQILKSTLGYGFERSTFIFLRKVVSITGQAHCTQNGTGSQSSWLWDTNAILCRLFAK